MSVLHTPSISSPILGLSHVGVKASDIERSCAFYRDFLGFAEQCRLNYLATGELMLVCFKINDDQWIEVFTGLKPGENRMHQVAFRVADAEQIRTRLAARNFGVPETAPTGQMGNFNFIVPDPSGQIIEFVQPLSTGITERDRGKFLSATRVSAQLRHARILVNDLTAGGSFYDPIGLPAKSDDVRAVDKMSTQIRRISNGDFVEFVAGSESEAQFSLEVIDLADVQAKLEHSPYRPRYSRTLLREFLPDGTPFIDVFDPDGTCVRLMEPALESLQY